MNEANILVIERNNIAVSHLQTGNYQAAVCELEKALEYLEKQMSYQSQMLSYKIPGKEISEGTFLRVASVPIAPSTKVEEASNVFRFYRRAFRVSSYSGSTSMQFCIRAAIVILFNIAIAYQDDAIRRDKMSHFVKALDLYREILFIMNENGIKGHLLLLMAISNNMGWIHSYCDNFVQTRESLFWVHKLVHTCREQATMIPYDEYKFFSETVVIFPGDALTVAPAA